MVQEAQSQLARAIGIGASVPIGSSGLVHVWARNDMASTQALFIDWVVRDPDGIEIEHHYEWSSGHGPGDDHEFIGGRRDINKAGEWTIGITMMMNPADPVIVDNYVGLLCRVTEEYAGSITKKELEYDGDRGAIPVQ